MAGAPGGKNVTNDEVKSQQHTISGRTTTVGEAMERERAHLLPLAEEGFELKETLFPQVDGQGLCEGV